VSAEMMYSGNARKRQTKAGYFVCEEGSDSKLLTREISGVEQCNGLTVKRIYAVLWCKSLFTVCQRRLELSDDDETGHRRRRRWSLRAQAKASTPAS